MDSCDVFTIVFRKKKAGVILTIWTVPTRVSLINKLYKEILLSSRVLYPLPKSEKAFCSWIKRWIGMGWWVLSLGWVLGCLVWIHQPHIQYTFFDKLQQCLVVEPPNWKIWIKQEIFPQWSENTTKEWKNHLEPCKWWNIRLHRLVHRLFVLLSSINLFFNRMKSDLLLTHCFCNFTGKVKGLRRKHKTWPLSKNSISWIELPCQCFACFLKLDASSSSKGTSPPFLQDCNPNIHTVSRETPLTKNSRFPLIGLNSNSNPGIPF